MTRKNSNRTTSEIKAMMAEDGDFLRPIVRTVIEEFLEAEMTEAIGAHKGERVEGRSGYRSGYYPRSLITRVGKLELRVPQDRNGRFSTDIFEVINAVRRRWWLRSPRCTSKGYRLGRSKRSAKSSADTVLARVRSADSTRSLMRNWGALAADNLTVNIPI